MVLDVFFKISICGVESPGPCRIEPLRDPGPAPKPAEPKPTTELDRIRDKRKASAKEQMGGKWERR